MILEISNEDFKDLMWLIKHAYKISKAKSLNDFCNGLQNLTVLMETYLRLNDSLYGAHYEQEKLYKQIPHYDAIKKWRFL